MHSTLSKGEGQVSHIRRGRDCFCKKEERRRSEHATRLYAFLLSPSTTSCQEFRRAATLEVAISRSSMQFEKGRDKRISYDGMSTNLSRVEHSVDCGRSGVPHLWIRIYNGRMPRVRDRNMGSFSFHLSKMANTAVPGR